MSTVAQLDRESVRLEAGDQAAVSVEIRNTGDLVEDYHLEIVGVPAAWTTIDHADFTLYPGSTTTALLDVHPPRSSSVPAGELRFGVHVTPREHPDESVVPEGMVEVLPFLDTTAELVPRTTHGRRGARHQVAIDNRGNVPVTSMLLLSDPAQALRLQARPEALTVDPGHASFVDVRVRPTKLRWRGVPVTHPFVVTVSPQDGLPVTLEGTHLQEPILPRWLGKALLALLALLLALAAIWFLLLKPTIESAAKEAVDQPQQVAQKQAVVAGQEAAKAKTDSAAAGAAAKQAQAAATQAQKIATGPLPAKTVTAPDSNRLEATTAKGATSNTTYTVKPKQSLALTDLVLENSQGDFGTVRLSVGTKTLISLALENFRNVDYHFVSPIEAPAGSKLKMTVLCRVVGVPPAQTPVPTKCSTAVYFGGMLTKPAPTTPAP